MRIKTLLAVSLVLGLSVAAIPAAAAVVYVQPNADITTTPFTITFASNETLTFSANTSAFEGTIGVTTSGGAQVFSVGPPFYVSNTPTSFQVFSSGGFPTGQLGFFAPYATVAGIPYSIAESLIGFEYTLADGIHYGIADIGGSSVSAYHYQTTAGADVPFGVPEPGAWAMLLAGVVIIGGKLRSRRVVEIS